MDVYLPSCVSISTLLIFLPAAQVIAWNAELIKNLIFYYLLMLIS